MSSPNKTSSNLYKVICDYEHVQSNKEDTNIYLKVVKGDILIDCELVDGHWFRGKVITTDIYGRIPKSYLVPLDSSYDEDEETSDSKEEQSYADIDDLNVTENPLCYDKVENVVPENLLSKYKRSSGNYVDMSSDESINKQESKPLMKTEKSNPIPKPKRAAPPIVTIKTSDEGYNSGSHYSGETQESHDSSNAPLLVKETIVDSKQDEAGYEVPNICVEIKNDKSNVKEKKDRKARRKSLKNFLKRKSVDEKCTLKVEPDEARERYYDPPTDTRDSYFLPEDSFFTLRILLSFIAALSLFLIMFLVLLLVFHLHAFLSFSISFIFFIVVLITPVTLPKLNILCVFTLLLPSLVSARAKCAIVILLFGLLLIGPILGIVSKLDTAIYCTNHKNDSVLTTMITTGKPGFNSNQPETGLLLSDSQIEKDCQVSFGKVGHYCRSVYKRFKRVCERRTLKEFEKEICEKEQEVFCFSNATLFESLCKAGAIKSKSTGVNNNAREGNFDKQRDYLVLTKNKNQEKISCYRSYIIYLFPLLVLLVLFEAYDYNVIYLTTKNNDNIYITGRIKQLDSERKNRGLSDVIVPLTRIEFQSYLLRRTLSVSKFERDNIFKWLFIWFICGFITLMIILTEHYIDVTLLKTQSDLCIEYYRVIVEVKYRVFIYIALGMLFICIVLQSYVLRLRSVICDHFYQDMIDTRSKHLYYKILHDRTTFSKQVRRKIQLLSEEKRLMHRISYKNKFRNALPDRLQVLLNNINFTRCMVCNSLTRKIVECNEKCCQAHYCFECYVDAGQTCLICKTTVRSASIAI